MDSVSDTLQPLPIGIQDFAQLRERGFLYVDKTEIVHHLLKTSTAVFLSRPRRFGKSLLISVFQNLYEGRRELFQGLWIKDHWDWSKTHPVVRISFGAGKFRVRGSFRAALREQLRSASLKHGIDIEGLAPEVAFARILSTLSERGPKPVVLIDEYDKPILQCLEDMSEMPGVSTPLSHREPTDLARLEAHEEELSVLEENRQDLRAFYSCLKDASPEFLFMTGVSRLAKASVFSELNHLDDITWAEEYAALCGITHQELERDFAPHLKAMAQRRKLTYPELLERLRKDYDGFRLAAGDDVPTVYNPFSTCRALKERDFGSYWTETGTPEFLVRLMRNSNVELGEVEGVWLSKSSLATLDPNRPRVLPLLLQTGYLTIVGWEGNNYRLGFPNREVQTAFLEHLLLVLHDKPSEEVAARAQALAKALLSGRLDKFLSEMKRVFTGIAYQLDDAHEKRYHGLFHVICILAFAEKGLVLAEIPNAIGRSDLVIDLPEVCWIFEFKRDTDTAEALAQIAEKEYANQWEGRKLPDGSTKPVKMVAVTFGTESRNIVAWEIA